MQNTKSAAEAREQVAQAAVKKQDVRRVESMEKGDVVRQGDVYLVRIEDGAGVGAERKNNQLAPGVSKGSRHILSGPATTYEPVGVPSGCGISDTALLGPVVVASDRVVVTHPEHAHIDLPAGKYQCLYQMDARTQRRVQD